MTAIRKHGLYSKYFTPEEINRLDTISPEQFLADIKRWVLEAAVDLLMYPDLPDRERRSLIVIIKAMSRKVKP